MLNSGITAVFGLLFWIIAAHYVPVDQVGYATSIVSAVTLITALSNFGMDSGLIRFLPMIKNKSEFYSAVMTMVTLCSLAFALLFLILTPYVSPLLAFLRDGWFPLIFLGYTLVTSICYIQNVSFMALRKADLLLVQNLILAVRIPILLLIAWLGVAGVISSYILAYIVSFIFGTFVLLKYGLTSKFSFNIKPLGKTIGYTSHNFIAELFYIAPASVLPIMIVNMIGAEKGAYYYIAYSIASMLFMIPSAVSSSLFVEGSYDQPLKENVVKALKIVGMILIPIIIFIFLFGDKLLLLFSKEYSDQAFQILKLMALSSLFSSIVSIYVSINRVTKHTKNVIFSFMAVSTLLIVLGYVFVTWYGLIGLGYAWLVSYILVSGGIIVYVIKWKKWLWNVKEDKTIDMKIND